MLFSWEKKVIGSIKSARENSCDSDNAGSMSQNSGIGGSRQSQYSGGVISHGWGLYSVEGSVSGESPFSSKKINA
jgi:hypothetical protein